MFSLRLAALLLCASPLCAQSPAMPGHINLRVLPPVAKDLEALPRVLPNAAVTAAAAARINHRLDLLDAAARQDRKDCFANITDKALGADFSRNITVTMRGPRFLAFADDVDYTCGGPHPDHTTTTLAFDVTTGEPIRWTTLLPRTRVTAPDDPAAAAFPVVIWPAVARMVLAAAEPDCRDVVDDPNQSLSLELDGDQGVLLATPAFVPHVEAPCQAGVTLTIAALKRLGASPLLTDALLAAHNDPSPEALKRRHAKP